MNFLRHNFLFLCIGAALATTSCGPNDGDKKIDDAVEVKDLKVAGTPFTRDVDHDTCLFIAHKVKEYDVWKASFDIAQPVREKHGIKALNVYKEMSDTSLALVFTEVTDLQEAKDYITSDNLQNSMLNAGVVGSMDLYWMETKLSYDREITDSIHMFMSFKVISYDRWEDAFLSDYIEEPNRDFQVSAVMRGVEDDGQVSMIFAVNDPDYVQKMEKDNAFRAKMLAAGVISYPVTYRLIDMPI